MKTKNQNWTARPLTPPSLRQRSARSQTPKPATDRPRLSATELAEWVERAKALPDLRWEKVQAVREALRAREYDVDSRIAEACRRLGQDWPGLIPSAE